MVEVALSGTGAGRPVGVGQYQAGDLDGHTIVVGEAENGGFQVGPSAPDADRLRFDLPDLKSTGALIDLDGASLASQASARAARVRSAAPSARCRGSGAGALLNRLGQMISFSENEIENLTSSESTLRDADAARTATERARAELLQGTSRVMVTQAFANSRRALRLL